MEATAKSQSFAEITREFAIAQPDRIALSFEGRNTTYGQFEDHTNQVANALLAVGVTNGDRIGYLGKNSDFYFEVFFGAAKMGAATTPINWRLAAPEVAYILQDFGCPDPVRRTGIRRHCRKGYRRMSCRENHYRSRGGAPEIGQTTRLGEIPPLLYRQTSRSAPKMTCSSFTRREQPGGPRGLCLQVGTL